MKTSRMLVAASCAILLLNGASAAFAQRGGGGHGGGGGGGHGAGMGSRGGATSMRGHGGGFRGMSPRPTVGTRGFRGAPLGSCRGVLTVRSLFVRVSEVLRGESGRARQRHRDPQRQQHRLSAMNQATAPHTPATCPHLISSDGSPNGALRPYVQRCALIYGEEAPSPMRPAPPECVGSLRRTRALDIEAWARSPASARDRTRTDP